MNEWESIWEWSQYKFVLKLHSWKLKKIDAQPLTSFKKVYSQQFMATCPFVLVLLLLITTLIFCCFFIFI